ncbi:MAG: translation initiation factor IF-2, partial [Candidatus Jacksonbacteria bacterium]|nr:translation initiation factor IF-2 [Candidatus Jacksonbacteria bacterium]
VSDLARQLKTEPNILLEKLPLMGFAVGERAIQIDDAQVDAITDSWKQYEKRERLKQKIAARQAQLETTSGEVNAANHPIQIPPTITVSEFAKRINVDVTKVIIKLMHEGVMAAFNERIDYETASIIAEDFGIKTARGAPEEMNLDTGPSIKDIVKGEETLISRPPVVVVMGHVDHGKTTLLDTIRKTHVADTESGAITQHMSAYQTLVKDPDSGEMRLITFIDTPGHEAFREMRSRGGRVADIAVLVAAADDKIQPQTLESINVTQSEGLALIVAINKVDKPEADIDRIKTQLSEINLTPEDWGGDTICVPISAKHGKNIEELLETILLVANVSELKASLEGTLYGTIIESHIDKGLGPIATAIIQNGTLSSGDAVMCGETGGKVKGLLDYQGKTIASAGPSTPVTILGLKTAARVGDIVKRVSDVRDIKKIKKQRSIKIAIQKTNSKTDNKKREFAIPIILKTDVFGTLEALLGEIDKIKHTRGAIEVVKQGLGNFTENDVLEGDAIGARLIGFKVKPTAGAEQLLRNRKLTIKTYNLIYELLDYLREELKKIIPAEIIEEQIGEAEVLAIFGKSGKHMILGGRVKDGMINTEANWRVFREDEVLGEGAILEIQSNKQAARVVRAPQEFGLKVRGDLVIKEGDILKFHTTKEVR